jgi:hypothetical protein
MEAVVVCFRDLKPEPIKYEAGVVTTEQRCSQHNETPFHCAT